MVIGTHLGFLFGNTKMSAYQIAFIAIILFLGIFVVGESFNLLAVQTSDEVPYTMYGSCSTDSDCGTSLCLSAESSCGSGNYKKWTSPSPDCINGFCYYPTTVGCFEDSNCNTPVGGSSCSTSHKYCCGTPQSDGDCTPHSIGSNYYSIFEVSSDCSHTFIKDCNDRCTINSDGSLPSSTCPSSSTCVGVDSSCYINWKIQSQSAGINYCSITDSKGEGVLIDDTCYNNWKTQSVPAGITTCQTENYFCDNLNRYYVDSSNCEFDYVDQCSTSCSNGQCFGEVVDYSGSIIIS